jgi:dihydrofolate synthase / folylpolyglutamate synthase
MYSRLPMFQRIGSAAYKNDLNNTLALSELLKHPERKFKSIHIAGTNGKGSTSHMLAAILMSAGYRTALYTSPHLKDFRERIKINGKMIPKQRVISFIQGYKEEFEPIAPSFFELTMAMAFDWFAQKKPDIAIIETGLGGRLDSTNIIRPELSVITNISFDHTNLLGNTLDKIAFEKAGIIKQQIPVIIGERQNDTETLFINKAKETKSTIRFADDGIRLQAKADEYAFDVWKGEELLLKNLRPDLKGSYQVMNLKTVIACALELKQQGWNINADHIREGIEHTVQLTGLRGRWEKLSEKPTIIADTGHNVAGIMMVVNQLKTTPHKKLHMVMGMVNDKAIDEVLQLLPHDAEYYFCKAKIPRALDEKQLALNARELGLKGETYPSVKKALNAARRKAAVDDLIFVGGSTFVVAEVV